jgi:hypothetical protein
MSARPSPSKSPGTGVYAGPPYAIVKPSRFSALDCSIVHTPEDAW